VDRDHGPVSSDTRVLRLPHLTVRRYSFIVSTSVISSLEDWKDATRVFAVTFFGDVFPENTVGFGISGGPDLMPGDAALNSEASRPHRATRIRS